MSNEQIGIGTGALTQEQAAADALAVNGYEKKSATDASLENGQSPAPLIENGVGNGNGNGNGNGPETANDTRTDADGEPKDGETAEGDQTAAADIPVEPSDDPVQKFLHKRQFVVQELIDTERDYARDLGQVVLGYMVTLKDMQLPEDFQGKDKIVYGNIQQIYEFHRDTFSQELEKCLQAPDRVGSPFVRYERRLSTIYVKYCENKPKSDYIVSEYIDTIFEDVRQKLGHRLQLQDLLIKPVQRIMKYQLLLKDIMKHSERAGVDCSELKRALDVMHRVPKEANDMMQVGRLQGFPGKITALGKLLSQDTLQVAVVTPLEPTPKYKERRVFLFEQMIIFSDVTERKRGPVTYSTYTYKNSAEINNMKLRDRLEPPENESVKFMIMHRAKDGTETKFFIDPLNEENRATWMHSLNTILAMQRDFLTALQDPKQYLKGLSGTDEKPASSATPPVNAKAGEPAKKISDTTGISSSSTSSSSSKPVLAKSLSAVTRDPSPADFGTTGRSTIGGPGNKKKNPFGSFWKGGNKKTSAPNAAANSAASAAAAAATAETEVRGPAAPSDDRKRKQPPSCKANKLLATCCGANIIECQPLVKVCEAARANAKNEELSVEVGEVLLVLRCNESATHLRVRRYDTPANKPNADAEGWIPLGSVGMADAVARSCPAPAAGSDLTTAKKNDGDGDNDSVSFVTKLSANTFARRSENASLRCQITSKSKALVVSWTRPDSLVCNKTGSEQNWSYSDTDDLAMLSLSSMQQTHAGLYTCLAVTEQSAIASATFVSVGDSPPTPGKPQISCKSDRSLMLSWIADDGSDRDKTTRIYIVESKNLGGKEWQLVTAHCQFTAHIIDDLSDGAYVFRIRAANAFGLSGASEESDEFRVPAQADSSAGNAAPAISKMVWKTGFEHHFDQVQKLHEGKFSSISLCKMKSYEANVITKHIRKQSRTKDAMTADANALDRLSSHPLFCKLMDRFDTSIDWILVFENYPEGNLCEYMNKQYSCQEKDFVLSEQQSSTLVTQLFDAVIFLNSKRLFHLRIRPESLLLCSNYNGWSMKLGSFECVCSADVPADMLAKLVIYANEAASDTNCCTEQIEFSSPFMLTVARKVKENNAEAKNAAVPSSLAQADLWSAGLIAYLLLHGRSLLYDANYDVAAASIGQYLTKANDANANDSKTEATYLSSDANAFLRKTLDAMSSKDDAGESLKMLRADKWLGAEGLKNAELPSDVIARFKETCERRLKFHRNRCGVCSSESSA